MIDSNSMIHKISLVLAITTLACVPTIEARADIFSDDFDNGASPLWGNEVGSWSDAGGVYAAVTPGNFPNAHSSLPFDLTDFSIELDINSVADGGVWLRSTRAAGTTVGRTGVLLVTLNSQLYWHNVGDGSTYGSSLNSAGGMYSAGDNIRLRIEVSGDEYSVFVNGSNAATTSLTTNSHSSGQIAVYSNSSQTFDNLSVVPEPNGGVLLIISSGIFAFLRKRRR